MKKSEAAILCPFPRLLLQSLLLLLLVPFTQLNAQSFAPNNAYNGWNGSTYGTIPTVSGLTFSQPARASGLSFTSAGDGLNSSGWDVGTSSAAQAVANNDYVTFSITANATTSFTVTSISLGLRRSGTGPTNFQVEASVNSGPFSLFGAPYSTSTGNTSNFFQALNGPVSVPAGGNVVFRIISFGSTNSAGTLRVLNGTAINGNYSGTPPTLSTTMVTGNPFCVSSTSAAPVTVGYTGTGIFSAGNVFTAQISDATGSFASPAALGTLTGTALTGTINGAVPAGTLPGTGYRIRVVSSSPAVTGTDNGSNLSVLQGIGFSHVVSDITCNGDANGSVTTAITEGVTPYTYAWSNSATTPDITGLSPGTYSLTITSGNGCTAVITSAIITEPAVLAAVAANVDIPCNGGTGAVNLAVSGGTTPYTFAWSNSATSQDLSNTAAGSYSVTITDNNGCTQTASATVTEPAALTASAIATDIPCNGGANGDVTLTVNGGTIPYTFSWSNSATTQDLAGLTPGTYSVTITDDNGCTQIASAVITEPPAIAALAIPSDALCNGGNGSVSLSVGGGVMPYSYLWNNNATTQNLSGVTAGTYSVTITDANNCTFTTAAIVAEPDPIAASTVTTDVPCNGGSNGDITLTVNGGNAPYTFAWSNSATTQHISGLTAGTYSVTITDDNGCTHTDSAVISETSAIAASALATDVGCNGGSNGDITLTVNGGVAPYTFAWSNSATTQNISGLASGTYSVTITDDNGCTQTASFAVTEPGVLSASATATDVLCNGANNGDATLTVSGGTAPYTFAWSNSATTQNLSALAPGSYSVTITDDNGCTQTASVTVTEPSTMSSSITSSNASCGACADGDADLTVNGGTAPYTYSWSNSTTTEDLTNVLPGTYTVVITDNNGCQRTDSVVVNFMTGLVNAVSQNNFSIYPNPSNGETITIQAGEITGTLYLSVYDVAGKEVYRGAPAGGSNGTYQVSLSLPNGSYVYQLRDENTFLQSGRLLIVK